MKRGKEQETKEELEAREKRETGKEQETKEEPEVRVKQG